MVKKSECDVYNNRKSCGYDGGDCCECTCTSGVFECGGGGYDCADPDHVTECPSTTPPPRDSKAIVSEGGTSGGSSDSAQDSASNSLVRNWTIVAFIALFAFVAIVLIVLTVLERRGWRRAGTANASSGGPKITPIGDGEYGDVDGDGRLPRAMRIKIAPIGDDDFENGAGDDHLPRATRISSEGGSSNPETRIEARNNSSPLSLDTPLHGLAFVP